MEQDDVPATSRRYELLAQCIRSGQLSADQIAEEMKDEVFRRWYERHYSSSAKGRISAP